MKEYCKCYDNGIGPPLLTNHHSFTNICQTCGKERKSETTQGNSLSGGASVSLKRRDVQLIFNALKEAMGMEYGWDISEKTGNNIIDNAVKILIKALSS